MSGHACGGLLAFLCFNSTYFHFCVHVCTCLSVCTPHACSTHIDQQGCYIPWNCSYRRLRAAQCRRWESNPDLQQDQQVVLGTEPPLGPHGEIILMTSFEVGRPIYSGCQISWWDPGLCRQRKVMSQAAPHVAVPGDTPSHTHCFLFTATLTCSKLLWLSYLSGLHSLGPD